MKYTLCWMDDDSTILATTENVEAENLAEAIKFAYGAFFREDGEGATQLQLFTT